SSAYGQAIEIEVTPGVTRGLVVSLADGATFYDFGLVGMDVSTVASSGFIVTNTGNIIEDFALQVTAEEDLGGSAPWASAESTFSLTTDRYALYALFESTGSRPSPFESIRNLVLKNSAVLAEPGPGGKYSGGQAGAGVLATRSVGLWFNLRTPPFTTNANGKKMTVTVSAN
ncbi:MAG: hypothetical protein L0209_05610, partial [candidate division Zixibacteria bacterium]|nr:hypothetical protein [candidate division Zixibacteria bacterium]